VLLRTIAYAANEANSVNDAMQAALDLVCRYAGWPTGHVFFVDDERRLVSSSIWHDDGSGFEVIRRRTEAIEFAAGIGLPGEVYLKGEPIWIEDVRAYGNFLRARGVADVGVGSAFGMPVVVGSDVRAVLEFFHRRVFAPDPNLLEVMTQVGALLGRVIEREDGQAALRQSHSRLAQALNELQSAQQAVIQQERLRALGQMASGIAHDFNNALMPIVGYVELMLGMPKFADDPDAADFLGNVLIAARDAAAVVSRLKEFYRARTEGDVFTSVQLDAIAGQVVDLTKPRWFNQALARGVRIAVETDFEEVLPIRGHEPELREAVTNLVLNAIDAMPDGGTITLRTRSTAGQVMLSVADTGVGMSEDVRRQCLDPFFTTKGEKGTGLGLGMVYGIVQRHRATLDVESDVGRGTMFTMTFPASEDERPAARSIDPARPTSVLRVLVAEDKPTVRRMMVALLAADGHHAEAVANGIEALARLQQGTSDVVVTDRAMPMMAGDELARRVKELSRPLPVIMATGFGVMMHAAGEHPAGVDAIIAKPVSQQALRDALARVTQATAALETLER
jgi:signal transduction histidine kinase/ActR/RegA family two-component response regulator